VALGNVRMQRGEFKAAEALLRQAVAYVRARGDRIDPEFQQIALSTSAPSSRTSIRGIPKRWR